MIKKVNYFFQSLLIYLFFLFGKMVGLKISRKIFGFIFCVLGPFFKSQKIIQKNLDIVSKALPQLDRKKIVKEMWKNYGMTFIEYIFLSFFKKNKSHITIEGEEILSKLSDEKKPVIFISGHFANFELMSMEITKKQIHLATIYRPLNNIFLNPFMEFLRKKYVCQNQIKKGINGVRDAIKFLKHNCSIALMIDQRVGEGERINFFNQPALTTTLPAQLSFKFDIKIVPVFIERLENNNFRIRFEEGINPKNFENKISLSEKLNKVIEKMIQENPNQWIWTHNRWR